MFQKLFDMLIFWHAPLSGSLRVSQLGRRSWSSQYLQYLVLVYTKQNLLQEPILGVWDGISIGNYSGKILPACHAFIPLFWSSRTDLDTWPIIPEEDLQPYIDDVVNEIEFITGDASTTEYGKLRASYGRTEPYVLKYIEMSVPIPLWICSSRMTHPTIIQSQRKWRPG